MFSLQGRNYKLKSRQPTYQDNFSLIFVLLFLMPHILIYFEKPTSKSHLWKHKSFSFSRHHYFSMSVHWCWLCVSTGAFRCSIMTAKVAVSNCTVVFCLLPSGHFLIFYHLHWLLKCSSTYLSSQRKYYQRAKARSLIWLCLISGDPTSVLYQLSSYVTLWASKVRPLSGLPYYLLI